MSVEFLVLIAMVLVLFVRSNLMESSHKAEPLAQRIARSERAFEARVLQRLGSDAGIVASVDAGPGAEKSVAPVPEVIGRSPPGGDEACAVDVPPEGDDATALAP